MDNLFETDFSILGIDGDEELIEVSKKSTKDQPKVCVDGWSYITSESQRIKTQQTLKGKCYRLNYSHSEQTKQKISSARKGLNTKLISTPWGIFASVKEARLASPWPKDANKFFKHRKANPELYKFLKKG